jgi:putative salt-induced outer membrane protein YdiY
MKVAIGLFCLYACVIPDLALAQTSPPPPRLEQRFETAYVGVAGNSSSNTFSVGADFVARPDSWLVRDKFSFVRNQADGVLAAKAFEYASRVQKTLNERASTFAEYDFFRDPFAGVIRRQAGTIGFALNALTRSTQAVHFDLGAGYTNERRQTGENVSSGSYLAGADYKLSLSANADLTDDLRVSGIFADARNWHAEHTIAVTTKLAGGLSLKVSNALRFANFPPPGFRRTDSVTSIALVAKFTRPTR